MDQRREKDNPAALDPQSPQHRPAFIYGSSEHAFFAKMR
jgi:hypothetical protein